nr:NADH dehydrogenase subunit 3 [Pennella sp. (in: crustaceans)]
MLSLVSFFIMSSVLSVLVMGAAFMFSSKISSISHLKMSPFECGFDSKDLGRPLFSMHFFLLAILFLVFDLELVILFPFLIFLGSVQGLSFSAGGLLFLLILLLGLVFEWNQGFLEWSI